MARKKVIALADVRRERSKRKSKEDEERREEWPIDRTMALIHHRKAYRLELDAGLMPSAGLIELVELMHKVADANGETEPLVGDASELDWEAIAAKLGAPFDARRARQVWDLFDWLGMLMLKVKRDEDWRRLDEALAAITNTQTDSARRREVFNEVAIAVDRVHGVGFWGIQKKKFASNAEALWAARMVPAIAKGLVTKLKSIEPAFGKLNFAQVGPLLLKTHPMSAVIRGGAGKMGPALLTARLTVKVGAFGDTEEAKSKKRYLAAEQSAPR